MSFQLLNIAVYNAKGDRREIAFRTGQVNIVTGGSRTGKTALIYIVDYCLGRTDCTVPAGIIRDTVAWYAIRIQGQNSQVVIARPAPPDGQQTTTDAFLAVGGDLALPNHSELKKNTTTGALRQFLTEVVGITPNRHIPPVNQSRPPLSANVGHTCFYLFQPQDYIARRNILFYRQDEPQIPQAISDTLPFLLGAVGDDRFEKLQELRKVRRDVRLLEKRLEEEEQLKGHDNSRAIALLAEAQQVSLLPTGPASEDFGELVERLRQCLGWQPTTPTYEGDSTLAELQLRREQLRDEVSALEREIETAKAFALRQEGFSQEVIEQQVRLKSIGLYKDNGQDNPVCPLCNHELAEDIPKAQLMRGSLKDIDKQMEAVARQRPRLDAYISERQVRLATVQQSLAENRTSIEAIVQQQEVLQAHRTQQATQARTVGRISLFLDSLRETTESDSQVIAWLAAARQRVEELEQELADEGVEDRLQSALRIIGDQMSVWAQHLKLEFSEWPLAFDIAKLTVVAFRDSGKVRLLDMGSAENWMGYHLVTHLALHKWFVEKVRPVPHFLMLDQPTQVYFPKDPPKDGSFKELKDEDRQKVHRLFKFIFDTVKALHPHFQVIITDHADLQELWYQRAIVQRWWGKDKFIPVSWTK
ncbi:MAG TPA: DUF3732 domain-containing protein [Pirellulales bacterium]|nr:DUF3732 domain-containing protein [Pirellulales bacterium]